MRVFARVVDAGTFTRAAVAADATQASPRGRLRVFVDWVVALFARCNKAGKR